MGKGVIAATSRQCPLKMAALGVAAGVDFTKGGKKSSGYVDTGITLIATKAVTGVDGKDVKIQLPQSALPEGRFALKSSQWNRNRQP